MLESRIFALLENEMKTGLNFTFCLLRNVSRPGATSVCTGDHFLFTVRLRNDCGFRLTDVRGSVDPTELTEFQMLRFDLPELMAGQDVHIGEAGARLISRHANDVFGNIGHASISARLDLSSFKFQEWEKPLIHSAAQATIAEPMSINRDLGYHSPQRRKLRADDADFCGVEMLPLSRIVNR